MERNWFKYINAVTKFKREYATKTCPKVYSCKLLVVGGGAGGCTTAWRFAKKLAKKDIIVLEPSQEHYYQPLFTLVAAGTRKFQHTHRPTSKVLPPGVRWLQDSAEEFDPRNCLVYTYGGNKIRYEYMVVALGLINDYDQIPYLKETLDDPKSGVCTIYSADYCARTWDYVKGFRGGHAVFTFPRSEGKCSGAAQKIMYLADDYWRMQKLRRLASITYNTGANNIFGVPKYAAALRWVASKRCIAVNYCTDLVKISQDGAVFRGAEGQLITLPYNLLHVTPPMSTPACLKWCSELANSDGYLEVDRHTLQHARYPNVFGVGDCLCTPNSKTAAAVAGQSGVLEKNLLNIMSGKPLSARYEGYGACLLLTSYKRGLMAEFLYDKKICETFPFDQSKERRFFYRLNADILPYLYWKRLLQGKWNGPATLRRIINPFAK